jgi:hypothetical protein
VLNIPVKLASAFLLVLAPLAASFAVHVGSASRTAPILTDRPGRLGKCLQAQHERVEFVHPEAVCWAPRDITDDPALKPAPGMR